jgi:hypothetical protein
MRTRIKALTWLGVLALAGCVHPPKDLMRPSESALQLRQQQSRRYETTDEIALLSASVALLQDMGFSIDQTDKDLGILCASKTRDAVNAAQATMAILVALTGGGSTPIDAEQKMRVGIVVRPIGDGLNSAIRATFQRVVLDTRGRVTRQELLSTDDIYTEFFDRLSKAIFLEAHDL